MSCIVAAATSRNIVPVLVEGLRKLEYRAYTSAGQAVVGTKRIEQIRSVGRGGAYAIAVIDQRHPDKVVVAREGSPLWLGLSGARSYTVSDASALLQVTRTRACWQS